MNELKKILSEQYRVEDAQLNGVRGSEWHKRRQHAFEQFSAIEFPTQRTEDWKFVNLQSMLATTYSTDVQSTLRYDQVEQIGTDTDHHQLIFVNGRLVTEWTRQHEMTFVMSSLHAAYETHRELIDKHLAQHLPSDRNAFVAGNTACMNDGAFVYVPRSATVSKDLHILNIIDARESARVVQPRNLILLERASSLSIVMRTITIGAHVSLSNQATELVIDADARFECVSIQDDSALANSITNLQCEQSANSHSRFVTVSLSGAVVRNDLGTRLLERGAEAHMFGLYSIAGSSVVDNHTVMDHAAAHCHSNELYKGILDASSQGVFNGKIFVRQDAQKTLAYQSNRNVILSDRAGVNTKPQLEILADDVKCSHGCTVGTLDEEALFYLRARGIGEQQARALLLTAFAEDVSSNIRDEAVRGFVNAKIESQLLTTHE